MFGCSYIGNRKDVTGFHWQKTVEKPYRILTTLKEKRFCYRIIKMVLKTMLTIRHVGQCPIFKWEPNDVMASNTPLASNDQRFRSGRHNGLYLGLIPSLYNRILLDLVEYVTWCNETIYTKQLWADIYLSVCVDCWYSCIRSKMNVVSGCIVVSVLSVHVNLCFVLHVITTPSWLTS